MPSFEQYRGHETILVADDEPVVLSLASNVLKLCGYNVLPAKNGSEALRIWEERSEVDLVLTDVIMPEYSGPELVHEIRKRNQDVRCVFMSGYEPAQIQNRGLDAGCDYLRKPFTPELLLRRVRATLDSRAA